MHGDVFAHAKPHRTAVAAAASMLEERRRSSSSVEGYRDGFAVTFRVVGTGWRITVGPVSDQVAFTLREAHPGSATLPEGATFDDCYRLEVVPDAAGADLFTEEIRRTLTALRPRTVELLRGRMTVEKHYVWAFAERAEIRDAVELATRLARLARATPRPAPTPGADQLVGAPYRPHAIAVQPSGRQDIQAFEREVEKRRKAEVDHTLLRGLVIAVCVLLWPIGLVVLVIHHRRRAKRSAAVLDRSADDSERA